MHAGSAPELGIQRLLFCKSRLQETWGALLETTGTSPDAREFGSPGVPLQVRRSPRKDSSQNARRPPSGFGPLQFCAPGSHQPNKPGVHSPADLRSYELVVARECPGVQGCGIGLGSARGWPRSEAHWGRCLLIRFKATIPRCPAGVSDPRPSGPFAKPRSWPWFWLGHAGCNPERLWPASRSHRCQPRM